MAAAEVQDQTPAGVAAELTKGPFVSSTAESLRTAEALEPVQDADFELRLLRAPALNLLALWLHTSGSDDLFVPLDPRHSRSRRGSRTPSPSSASWPRSLRDGRWSCSEKRSARTSLGARRESRAEVTQRVGLGLQRCTAGATLLLSLELKERGRADLATSGWPCRRGVG